VCFLKIQAVRAHVHQWQRVATGKVLENDLMVMSGSTMYRPGFKDINPPILSEPLNHVFQECVLAAFV